MVQDTKKFWTNISVVEIYSSIQDVICLLKLVTDLLDRHELLDPAFFCLQEMQINLTGKQYNKTKYSIWQTDLFALKSYDLAILH